MGPSACHITPQALASRISTLPSSFTVTVDVHISVFARHQDLAQVKPPSGG